MDHALMPGSATAQNNVSFAVTTGGVSTVVPAHAAVQVCATSFVTLRATADGSSAITGSDMYLPPNTVQTYNMGQNTRLNIQGNQGGYCSVTILTPDTDEV